MQHGIITPKAGTVGLTSKPTDGGCPELVGIPVFHQILPTAHMSKLLRKAKCVVASLAADDPPATPLLRLRALHSSVLGAVDLVLLGVLIDPPRLTAVQAQVNKAYHQALGAPKWGFMDGHWAWP